MFINLLKIAVRNLLRQKAHSIVNIGGLAIGMTCSLLILMWVLDEYSYDRFNEKADELGRVVETQHYTGGQVFPLAVTPTALAGALKEEVPGIERSTRFAMYSLTMRHGGNAFTEGVGMADPDFLDMFTLRFLKGNPATALSDPHSMILTQDAARKYFGAEDPMGKVLNVENRYDFIVTGVIENIPHNSHLQFDLLAPFVFLKEQGSSMTDWNSNWCFTYVLLQKGMQFSTVSAKLDGFMQRHTKSDTEISLQPLTEIHLYSAGKYAADLGGQGDIEYVRIFFVIALFVLLIACVNFMNLATARSERRAKEVGLRKVVGASRSQLVRQFFGEALLMTMIAFLIAVVCTELLLPSFNTFTGKSLSLSQLDSSALAGMFAIAVIAGLISGSYPALLLSSFQPVDTIKGMRNSALGGASFRKILVVLQFTLSVIMVIGALVVSEQIDYLHNKNLGLNKVNLGYFWISGDLRQRPELAKREILNVTGVSDVTVTDQLPTSIVSATTGWDWEGKSAGTQVMMRFVNADDDYLRTFQMSMAAGRFFSPELATDSLSAVVNETAARAMGLSSPLGKRLSGRGKTMTIIGVVKDFNFAPLQKKIEPLVLLKLPKQSFVMVVRLKSQDLEKTIAGIEAVYKKFTPDTPFYFNFLNEDYDQLYRAEERVQEIAGSFTTLAVFIAALGLYGLASYASQRRTKEISVRKVLGASDRSLYLLLSRDFILLGGIANLIAWPVAYYVMRGWLENYAYHASLGIGVFLGAAAFAFIIILLTVSYQTLRVLLANPVEALRYE